MKKSAISLLLLSTGALLLAGIDVRTSLNRTEVAHFGAAAYFWRTGRNDLFHVNPPMGRLITGLPIALCGPDFDWSTYSQRPQDRSEWNVGTSLIFANPPEKVRRMYVLGRLACITLILLGGWFGFRLASEMFGYASGLVFTILWSFSPLFLGWGATLCPDMIAASFGMIATATFRRWLLNRTWKSAVIAGFCVGLLPLAKLTWIVALGLFPLLWLLASNKPPLKQLLVMLLLALYTLNMGYFFDGSFRPLKEYSFISQSLRGETGNRFSESLLGYVLVPLPKEFVLGIDTQKRDFEKGLESYLFGTHADRGWLHYYLVVLALKEPIGTLILFGFAVWLVLAKKEYRAGRNDELLILLPFLTLFSLVSFQTGISIHPRYLLPAMPFFYLFVCRVGKAFSPDSTNDRYVGKTVILALGVMVASSLYAYPYSMSYFNEFVPKKERPKYLLGSNIDWGQAAYDLREYLKRHPEMENVRIAYPCPETIDRLGIDNNGSPPADPENGWYALGVNDLYAASRQYAWLQKERPVAVVGDSIYIFHVRDKKPRPENREDDDE